jgi:flagellar basal body-associated protein FliL
MARSPFLTKLLGRKRSKSSFVAMGLGLLGLAGVVLVLFYGSSFKWSLPWRPPTQGPAEASGQNDVGPVVPLEPFLVTEWEEGEQRLVTITFELEVADDDGRDAVKARTSIIRSEILSLLADAQLSTIGDRADFEALKAKVQVRLQPLLPQHPIRRVLITEFLTL